MTPNEPNPRDYVPEYKDHNKIYRRDLAIALILWVASMGVFIWSLVTNIVP